VQAIRQADVLLVLHTLGRKLQVPAKVYEYLGAGRPILALGDPDGAMAELLADSGTLHRVVPPNNPADIGAALLELIRSESGQSSSAAEGRLRYTRESLAGQLAEFMDKCRRPDRASRSPSEALLTASGKETS
jgi:glycosyltransferase involved in cell wall biosynthesis